MDRVIAGSLDDTEIAEKMLNHKWHWKEYKKAPVVNFYNPAPLDSDIVATQEHLAE